MIHLPDSAIFQTPTGRISLVGAGPGAADLLTLRALRRMQAADVVYHDRLVDPEVLALIPPQAKVVNVGKDVGRCAWPQETITARILLSARQGLAVVRLKSGDPSVFGRAAEEISAARALGIEIEVIPGVTAASAAAATVLSPLTERNRIDRLLLMTATSVTGGLPDDLARSVGPGTRLAIYMGVHLCGDLQKALLAAGLPADAPVLIVQSVSTKRERSVKATLQALAETVRTAGICNPAVIFVDIPLSAAMPAQRGGPRRELAKVG